MLHRALAAGAKECVQSPVWTDCVLRSRVKKTLSLWMLRFTHASRGAFIAKRFRKGVFEALVRVGEEEVFTQQFPLFECNPRNIISRLRPNDSKKYDEQLGIVSLQDVIQQTLAAYTFSAILPSQQQQQQQQQKGQTNHDYQEEEGIAADDPLSPDHHQYEEEAEEQDRDTPPDYMAARREVLIHCLDQLFQETSRDLSFLPFLVRVMHTASKSVVSSDLIAELKNKAHNEKRVIIFQTLGGFSVWNPMSLRFTVAGDLFSAFVEWALEIIRSLGGQPSSQGSSSHSGMSPGEKQQMWTSDFLQCVDRDEREGVGIGDSGLVPISLANLWRILQTVGLQNMVLNVLQQ